MIIGLLFLGGMGIRYICRSITQRQERKFQRERKEQMENRFKIPKSRSTSLGNGNIVMHQIAKAVRQNGTAYDLARWDELLKITEIDETDRKWTIKLPTETGCYIIKISEKGLATPEHPNDPYDTHRIVRSIKRHPDGPIKK